jgi:myo-inositol catabolism protein IolS
MKFRRLGKSGINVSVIGVGSWQFGGEWGKEFSQSDANNILSRAKELGINLIDTAECYGDHLSEQLIGEAIKGNRDQWIIATKFGHKFHSNFNRTDHWSAQEVRQQLEDSLAALQTDYIDLYQAHGDHVLDDDELWGMLHKQVEAGKIRHLGISIGDNLSADATSQATRLHVDVIQVVYNRLDRNPEEAVLPSCIEQDLGVLARVPLASGFLSGKYRPGTAFTDDSDVRSRHNPDEVQRKLHEVASIRQQEVPKGIDMAQWALAWCLQHPGVTSVIPGMKSVEQVEKNAAASDLEMVLADHRLSVN